MSKNEVRLEDKSRPLERSTEVALDVLSSLIVNDESFIFCEKENRNSFATHTWDIAKKTPQTALCSQSLTPPNLELKKTACWPITNSSGHQPHVLESCVQDWDVEEEVQDEMYDLIDVTPFQESMSEKASQNTHKIDVPYKGKRYFHYETLTTFGKENNNLSVTSACYQLTPLADKLRSISRVSIRSSNEKGLGLPKQHPQDWDVEQEDLEELYDLIDITPLKKLPEKRDMKKKRKIRKRVLYFEGSTSKIHRESSTKRGRQIRHPDRYKPVEKVAVSMPRITEVSGEASSEESCCGDSSFEA